MDTRVRELIDLASDAAFAIDHRCQVTAWNRQAEQLIGYAFREVIDRSCGEVLQAVLPGGEPCVSIIVNSSGVSRVICLTVCRPAAYAARMAIGSR